MCIIYSPFSLKPLIFIPDYYLNKSVNYVDPQKGKEVLDNLIDVSNLNPNFESHRNVVQGARRTYWGEVPEKNLYDELKRVCSKLDESMAVFHGLNIYKFDPDQQDNNAQYG